MVGKYNLIDTIVRRDCCTGQYYRPNTRAMSDTVCGEITSYTDGLHYRVTPDLETGDCSETDANVSSTNDPADEANAPTGLGPTRDELEAVLGAAW